MTIYFDDSLPALAEIIADRLGDQILERGVVVRDTSGRLCFFTQEHLANDLKGRLADVLTSALGQYARSDRVLSDCTDFGTTTALESADRMSLIVGKRKLQLIDNRLVGVDWLRAPKNERASPPRFVFASVKGGVGRSTALSIIAADAASRGKRVLAVDLDLEAPGLGSILLSGQTTPQFGMLDALVEAHIAPLSDDFFNDLVGASNLTDRGRVDVLPALGRRCLDHPEDVLAKIARAYVEVVTEDGGIRSLLDQVSGIIERAAEREKYDLLLIDARAGLHESAASALLGLGAELFCFGLDEPQTFVGYRALFAHVRRYSRQQGATAEWLGRVNFVQGKAPLDLEARADFARRAAAALSGVQRDVPKEVSIPEEFADAEWDDTVTDEELKLDQAFEASTVLAVLNDDNYRGFNPTERRDQLSSAVYNNTFRNLIDYVHSATDPSLTQ